MSHELPPEQDQPRKRLKTENDPDEQNGIAEDTDSTAGGNSQLKTDTVAKVDEQALREVQVGITDFVSPELPGFEGVLKQRYTDFLVNEIEPNGQVLHLRSTELPESFKQAIAEESSKETPASVPETTSEEAEQAVEKKVAENAEESKETEKETTPEFKISDEDKTTLDSYFTPEIATSIIDLHARALKSPNTKVTALGRVRSNVITDRDLRTNIHQAIRRIFAGRLESSTDQEGCMVITVNPPRKVKKQKNSGRGGKTAGRKEIRGKLGWTELGGEYLHFTLYKENKDTMEVVSFLARQLKMNPKSFQFAGTKDRRGVTAQRACVYRVHADRLAAVNRTLRSAVVGDFEYKPHGLDLGDLSGNEFVITLRDVKLPGNDGSEGGVSLSRAEELVSKSLSQLRERGYFNYYGLQRFGTFATRTDQIGVKMLQGDFQAAVDAILEYNPALIGEIDPSQKVGADDVSRARAIHTFKTSGKANAALDILPRKFSAESNIIRHLGRARNDYRGALQAIPRNLRLMYVHAYQSLVWNFAVGERWRLYGNKLVEGDLVLIRDLKKAASTEEGDKSAGADSSGAAAAAVDADGEVVVLPSAEDSAQSTDDIYERARPLTAEEAASGKLSIFDLVLPLPGFDVVYPENAMKDFYKKFMGSDRGGHLDPYDMRRSWKDISLSGGYRKVLSQPGQAASFAVKKYTDDYEQFVETDLEKLRKKETAGTQGETTTKESHSQEEALKVEKLAIILTIQLGTSQYATMALRELMKTGGVKTYKPDFGSGR